MGQYAKKIGSYAERGRLTKVKAKSTPMSMSLSR